MLVFNLKIYNFQLHIVLGLVLEVVLQAVGRYWYSIYLSEKNFYRGFRKELQKVSFRRYFFVRKAPVTFSS